MKEDPLSTETETETETSAKAAINTDSRMYNTLTFLDNDDSDDGGESGDVGPSHQDGTNKSNTCVGTKEKLEDNRRPSSDINDNLDSQEENAKCASDELPVVAKKKILPNLDLLKCDDLDLLSPASSVPDLSLHLGDYDDDEHSPDEEADGRPGVYGSSPFDGLDDWTDDLNDEPIDVIPEYTAREEFDDNRNWRPVQINGMNYRIDMKAIDPYKKVLSHGGYYGNGLNAIVVFAACYLPERSRVDYRYIMDNLFLYVVSVLDLLVVEEYMIVYFHAATSRNKMPALRWLKRCYDMIDHRLRKNLQRLIVVHPTFFLKTIILMTKPFISSKFTSKLNYVRTLDELTRLVPTEYIFLPDEVKEVDRRWNPNAPTPHKKFINL